MPAGKLGAEQSPPGHVADRGGAGQHDDVVHPGDELKQRRDGGPRRHGDRRAGRLTPHVGDRRQRHDGVAKPVGREDDQTVHVCYGRRARLSRGLDSVTGDTSDERTTMKIALLQVNPTVGDLAGNARLIPTRSVRRPRAAPISPPRRSSRSSAIFRAICCSVPASSGGAGTPLETLARDAADLPPVLVGLPEPNPSDEGRPLFNSAALLRNGRVDERFRKALLPTYDVFDEDRYFEPFHGAQVLDLGGHRVGISICEDIWNDRDFWKRRRYHHDPIEELVGAGADLVVNLSASPFTAGKHQRREEMLGSMALKHRMPIAYVNQFGGNDDLVFDGRSCMFNADGAVFARGRAFDAGRRRVRHRRGASDRAGIGSAASSPRSGARSSSARATTPASAASPRPCSACPAASIRR